jgi:UDP:flavonoid glycosyltransferase YjiC (YdhE family)
MASAGRRVLFISGSIGLGHVSRDLAIARELRRVRPDVGIAWLAAPPADRFLREAGEPLLPECAEMVDESAIAEATARGSRLSLIRYGFSVAPKWLHTEDVLARVTSRVPFDLVLGDEAYGVVLAFKKIPAGRRARRVADSTRQGRGGVTPLTSRHPRGEPRPAPRRRIALRAGCHRW